VCCAGSEGCASQSYWHRRETIRREKCVSTAVHNQARESVCVSCVGIKGVVYVLLAGDQDKTVREKRRKCEY